MRSWLGGLLDYYFVSGYRRALEVAELTGRFCARTPTLNYDITPEIRDRWDDPRQPWTYCTRTSGWALNGMAELYEVIADPALRLPMQRVPPPTLVEQLKVLDLELRRLRPADQARKSLQRFGLEKI